MDTNAEKWIPRSRFQREFTTIISNFQRRKYESLYVTRNNELWLVVVSATVLDQLTK